MADPIPAAAPTPAAAPAAPAAPTAPAAAPAAQPKSSLEMFDDLPDGDATPAAPAAPAAPAKPAEQPKAPAKPAPAAPADKSAFDPDRESNVAKLRKWGRELETQTKTLRQQEAQWNAEKAQLQTKLTELENKVPKNQADADKTLAQIADYQKRIEQYESVIRLRDYQQSEEYKTKYEAPYQNTYKKGRSKVTQLMVTEKTGEEDAEGKPITKERPGTAQDFDEIYQAPLGAAWKLAREKFGDAAPIVMQMREAAADLAEEALAAIEKYKAEGAEIEKRKAAESGTRAQQIEAAFRKANEALATDPKGKPFWGREENDPEANKALDKGFAIADKLFLGERDQMTPEDRVLFDAQIRHRIAGFSKLAHFNGKLRAENEALKKELEELRGSTPAAPDAKGGEAPATDKSNETWEEAFDRQVK